MTYESRGPENTDDSGREYVGKKIRAYREEMGISQKDLAKSVGLSPSYINLLEKGKRKSPTYTNLEKIANALRKPIAAFSSGKEIPIDILKKDLISYMKEKGYLGDEEAGIQVLLDMMTMTQLENAEKLFKKLEKL